MITCLGDVAGIFIVTSWLRDKTHYSFHEVARPMNDYIKEFPDYEFSTPVPVRVKYTFSIKRNVRLDK
jgi:hypothetical protein